jgi:transcriptional regulator with XRE-family HTH domain
MTKMIRLGARLRAARKAAGFNTSKEFLKKHKIPASTYSQHESGARIPDDDALHFYSKVFDVNFEWLKNGKGLPYKKISPNKANIMDEELINLSSDKQHQSAFNQELMTDILGRLISAHTSELSTNTVKSIAKEASRIYKDIISSASSTKMQMKLLKSAFAAYK